MCNGGFGLFWECLIQRIAFGINTILNLTANLPKVTTKRNLSSTETAEELNSYERENQEFDLEGIEEEFI